MRCQGGQCRLLMSRFPRGLCIHDNFASSQVSERDGFVVDISQHSSSRNVEVELLSQPGGPATGFQSRCSASHLRFDGLTSIHPTSDHSISDDDSTTTHHYTAFPKPNQCCCCFTQSIMMPPLYWRALQANDLGSSQSRPDNSEPSAFAIFIDKGPHI